MWYFFVNFLNCALCPNKSPSPYLLHLCLNRCIYIYTHTHTGPHTETQPAQRPNLAIVKESSGIIRLPVWVSMRVTCVSSQLWFHQHQSSDPESIHTYVLFHHASLPQQYSWGASGCRVFYRHVRAIFQNSWSGVMNRRSLC